MRSNTSDPRAPETDVLNMALLDQYRARKNNLLERLIDAYLAEAPGLLQNLRRAAESSDLTGMRANAHALKSCGYNLGAVRVSKICQEIETAAAAGDATVATEAASRIACECFEAEQALRSELYELKKAKVVCIDAGRATMGRNNELDSQNPGS
jgi:HPt (histidine-containing phosphotransfer) domain-containing protein